MTRLNEFCAAYCCVTITIVQIAIQLDMKRRELLLMFLCEIIIAAFGVGVDSVRATEKGEMVRMDKSDAVKRTYVHVRTKRRLWLNLLLAK